ncbi:MAG: hypothetical protein QM446_03095 [Synergistota bacterium]|nr:hypothetical protein [Synergistota bacterium]
MVELERAGIRSVFFKKSKEEKMMTKRELLKIQDANTAGATWMETILAESENPEEWLRLTYQEFLQAAANAIHPAFPDFESGEELDAAYQGAWDQLEFSRRLHAEDKVYQEDLEKRKKEGWYDGK